MSADTSRNTFRQPRHFSKLVSQQGRLCADADWNHQVDIQIHRERTTNVDVIGQYGVPEDAPGFAIEPTEDGTDLLISPGRLYVDGILVECDASSVPFTLETKSPLQIQPSAMTLDSVAFALNQWLSIFDEEAPGTAALAFEVSAIDITNHLLTLNPATSNATDLPTFLTTAVEPRMRRIITCTTQPDVPGFVLPTASGRFLTYLHVFERDISSLDDPAIIDPALGVDTCMPSKIVWQVGLLQVGDPGATVECDSDMPAWNALIAPSTGELAAQVVPDQNSGLCGVSATGGYTRPSNQHYRIEIHTGGANPGSVTFKWQRDNASIVTKWVSTLANTLTVSSANRDQVLAFTPGQWVELLSDEVILAGKSGTLVPLISVAGLNLIIDPAQATGSVDPKDFATNPQIRRWDSPGAVALTNAFQTLESGLQVKFANGSYKTGDHWLVPARTVTANIEWPTDHDGNPFFLPPAGIKHHYCHLGIVEFDGKTWTSVEDCRVQFPPLTGVSTSTDRGIHIREVRLPATNKLLLNDSTITPAALLKGITAVCDNLVAPESVSRPTCFVTLELPYPINDSDHSLWGTDVIIGYMPLILDARVAGVKNTIQWFPGTETGRWLEAMLFHKLVELKITQVLVHFTLKGNFIWETGAPSVYLDGEAFGERPKNAASTLIRFPSGNGKSGGDFDMWFWLSPTADAVNLKSFTLSPAAVALGGTVTATIGLSGPAPNGGTKITLHTILQDATGAEVPGAASSLPDSITVPAGQTSFASKVRLPRTLRGQAQVIVTASDGSNLITAKFQIRG